MPMTQQALSDIPQCRPFINAALTSTDLRIKQQKPLNPAFLYACFLWWPVLSTKQQLIQEGYTPAESMQRAIVSVIEQQIKTISIPRRFTQFIREVWTLQYRLETRRGKRLGHLLEHQRFRAAYDFLLLRTEVGEIPDEAAKWWTEIQSSDEQDQSIMINNLRNHPRKRKPRKRKPF